MSTFREFLAARFARRYLGLHLTIGFLICIAALWVFVELTENVVRARAMTKFDLLLHDWIRAHASVLGYATFGALTELGSPLVIGIMALLGAVVFYRDKRWLMLGVWLATFIGGGLLDFVLKLVIHRPRPPFASDYLVHDTFSYPSGHSMMSFVAWGMLAYVLIVYRARNLLGRSVAAFISLCVIALVGMSRLYLGVHFFSDVMAGFVAGAAWLTVCISALELDRRKIRGDGGRGMGDVGGGSRG